MDQIVENYLVDPLVPESDKELYRSLLAKADPTLPYKHIVLFKFIDVSEEVQLDCMQACRDLETLCGGREAGIVSYKVEKNFDTRKSWLWAEIVEFEDLTAFIKFHQHQAHKNFATKLRELGVGTGIEWAVFDCQ